MHAVADIAIHVLGDGRKTICLWGQQHHLRKVDVGSRYHGIMSVLISVNGLLPSPQRLGTSHFLVVALVHLLDIVTPELIALIDARIDRTPAFTAPYQTYDPGFSSVGNNPV